MEPLCEFCLAGEKVDGKEVKANNDYAVVALTIERFVLAVVFMRTSSSMKAVSLWIVKWRDIGPGRLRAPVALAPLDVDG